MPAFSVAFAGENIWIRCIASDLNLRNARHNLYLSRIAAMAMIPFMRKKVTLRELFPDQTDEQLERIAEFLHAYCTVVWRISERLEREQPEVIDELRRARSMKGKVDSSTKTN